MVRCVYRNRSQKELNQSWDEGKDNHNFNKPSEDGVKVVALSSYLCKSHKAKSPECIYVKAIETIVLNTVLMGFSFFVWYLFILVIDT